MGVDLLWKVWRTTFPAKPDGDKRMFWREVSHEAGATRSPQMSQFRAPAPALFSLVFPARPVTPLFSLFPRCPLIAHSTRPLHSPATGPPVSLLHRVPPPQLLECSHNNIPFFLQSQQTSSTKRTNTVPLAPHLSLLRLLLRPITRCVTLLRRVLASPDHVSVSRLPSHLMAPDLPVSPSKPTKSHGLRFIVTIAPARSSSSHCRRSSLMAMPTTLAAPLSSEDVVLTTVTALTGLSSLLSSRRSCCEGQSRTRDSRSAEATRPCCAGHAILDMRSSSHVTNAHYTPSLPIFSVLFH